MCDTNIMTCLVLYHILLKWAELTAMLLGVHSSAFITSRIAYVTIKIMREKIKAILNYVSCISRVAIL